MESILKGISAKMVQDAFKAYQLPSQDDLDIAIEMLAEWVKLEQY